MTRGAAATRRFSASSRAKLTHHDLGRFPGSTLFNLIGRVVAEAAACPAKSSTRRGRWRARAPGSAAAGDRSAAGHGLLAHVMLLLDDSSPSAVVIDTLFRLAAPIARGARRGVARTRRPGRVCRGRLDESRSAEDDGVVSSHACGALTDRRSRARRGGARARRRAAVLSRTFSATPVGSPAGWTDRLAIDVSAPCA